MGSRWLALAFVLACALAPPIHAARGADRKVDVVFDLDDTLVRWVRPDESSDALVVPEKGSLLGERYRIMDGALEMVEALSKDPNVRISIDSMGPRRRNLSLLSMIVLPDGRTLAQAVADSGGKVLSREDAVWERKNLHKDLTKINPDLSRVIIVDDKKDSTVLAQRSNILWIGKKPRHFPNTFEEAHSTEYYVRLRNRLARAFGILKEMRASMGDPSISAQEALQKALQEESVDPMRFYRLGAREFHQTNLAYRFTSVLPGERPMSCVLQKLSALH